MEQNQRAVWAPSGVHVCRLHYWRSEPLQGDRDEFTDIRENKNQFRVTTERRLFRWNTRFLLQSRTSRNRRRKREELQSFALWCGPEPQRWSTAVEVHGEGFLWSSTDNKLAEPEPDMKRTSKHPGLKHRETTSGNLQVPVQFTDVTHADPVRRWHRPLWAPFGSDHQTVETWIRQSRIQNFVGINGAKRRLVSESKSPVYRGFGLGSWFCNHFGFGPGFFDGSGLQSEFCLSVFHQDHVKCSAHSLVKEEEETRSDLKRKRGRDLVWGWRWDRFWTGPLAVLARVWASACSGKTLTSTSPHLEHLIPWRTRSWGSSVPPLGHLFDPEEQISSEHLDPDRTCSVVQNCALTGVLRRSHDGSDL